MNEEQEWRVLPSMTSVAKSQADGWEIEWSDPINYPHWEPWDGKGWSVRWLFRGRPRQPKTKKVKLLAYLDLQGELRSVTEASFANSYWTRVPSEDKDIEVPV